MSQMANLDVYDGKSTPVLHTLVPVTSHRENNGDLIAVYREQLASLSIEGQVSATFRLKKLPSGVYRTNIRVEVPVLEDISGNNAFGYTAIEKVAFIDTCEFTGLFVGRSSPSKHTNARQILVNICQGTIASVAPVLTGPAADLIDNLIVGQ